MMSPRGRSPVPGRRNSPRSMMGILIGLVEDGGIPSSYRTPITNPAGEPLSRRRSHADVLGLPWVGVRSQIRGLHGTHSSPLSDTFKGLI